MMPSLLKSFLAHLPEPDQEGVWEWLKAAPDPAEEIRQALDTLPFAQRTKWDLKLSDHDHDQIADLVEHWSINPNEVVERLVRLALQAHGRLPPAKSRVLDGWCR
jgi:hypothetical protein